jgi:cysteine desulfurase
LVAGLGKAAELAAEEMLQEQGRLSALMQRLLDTLSKNIDDLTINGSIESRIPGNLNVSFTGIDNSLFLSKVRTLALSSGSACASGNADPSHVLTAIGCEKERMQSAIRLGIGRFTSDEEIDFAASEIVTAVNEIKKGQ